MSLRLEFPAEISGSSIVLPQEVEGRLRLNGITKVNVVLTSAAEDEQALAKRGITSGAIDAVASMQRFDRDIATVVLSGEGAGAVSELQERLLHLAKPINELNSGTGPS